MNLSTAKNISLTMGVYAHVALTVLQVTREILLEIEMYLCTCIKFTSEVEKLTDATTFIQAFLWKFP